MAEAAEELAVLAEISEPKPTSVQETPPPVIAPPPSTEDEAKRRKAILGLVAVLLLLVVVAGGAFLLAKKETQTGNTGTQTTTGTNPPTETSSGVAAPPPAAATTTPVTTTPPPVDTGAAGMTKAITDYFALLPGGVETGYARLTDGFKQARAASFADYQGFWNDYSSVTTSDVSATGPNTVQATLTYTPVGGGPTSTEFHVYTMALQNGQWLIDAQT
jgi:hypothetical protein